MNEIFHRISVRKYEDTPVEPDKIEQLLRAAMAAPSAFNQQPWEFYVVTNRSLIEQLSTVTPYAGCAKNAPVVIVSAYREQVTLPAYCQIDMHCAAGRTDADGGTAAGAAVRSAGICAVCGGLSRQNPPAAGSL